MPKRKPDQVVRIEFALNRTDREVVERYLLFEKADRASETLSQVLTAFTSTDGGLIAAWFLLDLVDDWAIPDDGMGEILTEYFGGFDFWKFLFLPIPIIGGPLVAGEVAEHIGNVVDWNNATREQKEAAHPLRVKINDLAKKGKWVIFLYFAAKFGDDWINALGDVLPGTGGGGEVPPIPV